MQLTPRYLINDRIIVLTSETGFVLEYRPVYSRTLKVYRGIDNRLQFRLMNADQKPVTILGTPIFVAFDENQNLVLEKYCTVADDGSTKETRGMFDVLITEDDLLPIKQQYLNYNIYIEEDVNTRRLTYANRNFDSSGIIYIDGRSFPGPKSSLHVTNFYPYNNKWYAGNLGENSIYLYPDVNNSNFLHTVAVYTSGYQGTVKLQATLETTVTGSNSWATLEEILFTGNETEPTVINFYGTYQYLQIEVDSDPTDKIQKIVIRS
jgi:hypothetical protein